MSDYKTCKGYSYYTDCGTEYDCGYDVSFGCDECYFVVSSESKDKRKGKKPWAKKYQNERKTQALSKI
jgi:hypothetical protein